MKHFKKFLEHKSFSAVALKTPNVVVLGDACKFEISKLYINHSKGYFLQLIYLLYFQCIK